MKEKSIVGFLWMFGERIAAQLVTFIVSLVLARLLIPDDYGIVSIALVFINIANVFVSNGFSSAIIQKKEITNIDYNTAFISTAFISLIVYALIFILTPFISQFYGKKMICPLIRVLALRLPIGALSSIQKAYVSRNLQFRKFFVATIWGTMVSAVVGIYMAYIGLGAWAIAGQYLSNNIIDVIVMLYGVEWKPKIQFSIKSLKSMFSYSWKILVAAVFNEVYLELRSILIGKKYSSADLAYYNRGKQFPQLFYSNISSSISSVMFPIMSKQARDNNSLKNSLNTTIRILCFILFPIMTILTLCSRELVLILLTEKWLPCLFFLQAYCISFSILPIQTILEQGYKAVGRSDILLKLFIIEKIIGIIIIVISMYISTYAIAVGMVITSIISTVFHIIPAKKIFGYSLFDLFKSLLDGIVLSIVIILSVMPIVLIQKSVLVTLIIKVLVSSLVAIIISIVFKLKSLVYIINIVKGKINIKILNNLFTYIMG